MKMAKTTLQIGNAVKGFVSGAPLQEKQTPIKERKNKVISITLRQSDLQSMDDFCAKTGMSRTNLVRLAVQQYIDEYNRK